MNVRLAVSPSQYYTLDNVLHVFGIKICLENLSSHLFLRQRVNICSYTAGFFVQVSKTNGPSSITCKGGSLEHE